MVGLCTGQGGGVLDLIQVVLGCDRAGAVAWLSETFNLEIEGKRTFTPQERKRYARLRSEAEQFVQWRAKELQDMKERRTFCLRMYHAALRFILTHGLLDEETCRIADECERYEAQYFKLDQQIETFSQMSIEDQIAFYHKPKQTDAMQWDGASTW